MAEQTKDQLRLTNQQNFPNNNTGFITPDRLRDFNNDIIDSIATTADSASFSDRVTDLETFSSSLDNNFVSETEFTTYSGSATGRITDLEDFSSSLDADFVNETEFAAYTASQTAISASNAVRVTNLEEFSSSLDTNFVSETEFTAYSSSATTRITDLENFSSSISEGEVTKVEFNALTQSFNTFTASAATTGSNIFVGNQIISGNLEVSGSLLADLQEGYAWVGDSSGVSTQIPTSSIAGVQFPFTGSAGISGSIQLDGRLGITGSSAEIWDGSTTGSFVSTLGDVFTSTPEATKIVTLTQSEYDGITPDANTLYIISGSSQIAGSSGTSGTTGTAGTSGADGAPGTNGTAGTSGVDGVPGTNGTAGTSGVDGAPGTNGTAGTSGVDGAPGTNGTAGTSGVNGTNGTSGVSPDLSSYTGSVNILGGVNIDGILQANEIHTIYESASVIYSSGSTKFGDTQDDTHEFTGSVTISGSLTSLDATAELTASWALNALTASYVDNAGTSSFAQYADNTIVYGKNVSGGTIEKGTPLYFTGSGVSGNVVGVWPADAGNPDRMPAGGIAGEQMLDEAEGIVLIDGFINGVDTSAFESGDEVFVGVGGGYTNQAPTGSANLIQKLGNVEKVDNTNGSGVINGPGATRSLPNIESGRVWVGNGDDVPQSVTTSSLDVATAVSASHSVNSDTAISSSHALNSDNAISASHAVQADNATTADSATTAGTATTASYVEGANVDGQVASALSSSYALTASYAENAGGGAGFPFEGKAEITGSLNVTGSAEIIGNIQHFGNNYISGSMVIQSALSTGATLTVGRLKSTGNTGNSEITGSLRVSGSIEITSGSFTGSVIDNVTPSYGGVPEVKHVVTITSASYAALGTKDPNTLYVVSGSTSVATLSPYTGSVRGNVVSVTEASSTASIDLSTGNFFSSSIDADTHFSVTNVLPGQTAMLRVTITSATPTASFSPNVLQPSGSEYAPTAAVNSVDILTFAAFDSSTVSLVAVNKLI